MNQKRRNKAISPESAVRTIAIDGRLLKELRDLLSVANRKSGRTFGVSYRSLSGYENGSRSPPPDTLAVIFKSMLERARELDEIAGRTDAVTSETSFVAKVRSGQRRIIAKALDRERGTQFGLDPASERRWCECLHEQGPEERALQDSFVGQAEKANLIHEVNIVAARRRLAELLRDQGLNWLRNSRFRDAAQAIRESFQYAAPNVEDRLALVRALRPLSQRPDDDVGREIAALHAESQCDKDTPDWIDLHVSIGKTAYHYRDWERAENAFRIASEARVSDSAKLAEPMGHLAVVLFLRADSESVSHAERRTLHERAKECWERVLNLLTCEKFPHQHAVTQMRLGNYWLRANPVDAKSGTNLSNAYVHYETARQIWERLHVANYLAAIEYTLSDWELKRSRLCERADERVRHIDEALKLSKSAIQKLSPEAAEDWHNAHFNLAEACEAKAALERDNNEYEAAAAAYQVAADVYSDASHLDDWLATMLPLLRIKVTLTRHDPNHQAYRDSLRATLGELDAKAGDRPEVRRELDALTAEFDLGTLSRRRRSRAVRTATD